MTRAQIKLIQSLNRQKYRKEHNAYLVEGDKNAREWLLSDTRLLFIVTADSWYNDHKLLVERHPEAELILVKDFELEKITALQNAQQVILVAEQKAPLSYQPSGKKWSLLLEHIQDPGNMGTIIRTADWFGIDQLICTPDCVEVYNPKVVQASMGSLLRVNITENNLDEWLAANTRPLYAACLQGESIHTFSPTEAGVIALGNESRGLSPALLDAARHKVFIPREGGAESLNVAVAAGILCAFFTR